MRLLIFFFYGSAFFIFILIGWEFLGYPRYVLRRSVLYAIVFYVGRFDETGDDPPRDRTAELRALGFPTRHLGPVQMTTDTALGVTKRVVVDRGSLILHPPFFSRNDDGAHCTPLLVPLEEIPYVVRLSYAEVAAAEADIRR